MALRISTLNERQQKCWDTLCTYERRAIPREVLKSFDGRTVYGLKRRGMLWYDWENKGRIGRKRRNGTNKK